jgi:hypothetical protein
MLYFALVRPKLEYISLACTHDYGLQNLERIESKFTALYHTRFFQHEEYHYDDLLERVHLLTLHNRHHHFDALFLINVFSGIT